jgi:hypothetical protein
MATRPLGGGPAGRLCFASTGENATPERLHQGPIALDIGLVGGGIGHIDFCDDIHRRLRLCPEALHGHSTKSRANEYRKTPLIEGFHGVPLWLSSSHSENRMKGFLCQLGRGVNGKRAPWEPPVAFRED